MRDVYVMKNGTHAGPEVLMAFINAYKGNFEPAASTCDLTSGHPNLANC